MGDPTPHRPRRGASAVETALILPLLLGMVFSMVDISWWFFHGLGVEIAAEHAVRVASGMPDATQARTVVHDLVAAKLAESNLPHSDDDFRTDLQMTTESYGNVLVLTVRTRYEPLLGWLLDPKVVQVRATTPYYGDLYADEGDATF